MTRTYYIVEHVDVYDRKFWRAHRRGIFSNIFNVYNHQNYVSDTISYKGPDFCEDNLRRSIKPRKSKVVRVLKI